MIPLEEQNPVLTVFLFFKQKDNRFPSLPSSSKFAILTAPFDFLRLKRGFFGSPCSCCCLRDCELQNVKMPSRVSELGSALDPKGWEIRLSFSYSVMSGSSWVWWHCLDWVNKCLAMKPVDPATAAANRSCHIVIMKKRVRKIYKCRIDIDWREEIEREVCC